MDTLKTSASLNQVASTASAAGVETPLHHAELSAMARQTELNTATAGVAFECRGDLDKASAAIEEVLGIGLPDRLRFLGQPSSYSHCTLAWLSPDEWRLCCPIAQAYELEQHIRTALSPLTGVTHAIVNTSGGYTVLELYGASAASVLKKSTGYDVRTANFPVGKVVGTSFAKSSVTLLRTSEERWQLWVRRSFADYLWLWLQNAAAEYGLRITED